MKAQVFILRLVLAAVFAVLSFVSIGQDVIPTKGTEFWVGFMENYEQNAAESLDLFISSDHNTSGTVSIPLQNWSLDFSITANVTTTVSIPNNLAEHFDENQIISNKGVLIETADTVSVFSINFDLFTSDGTKILPTEALGTEYMVSSYAGLAGTGSELLIVATEDDTEVEITPSVDTDAGNLAGVPFTVQLDRGQSYQILQNGTDDDLTGTTIVGTEASGTCRPFAVFSGASCANIPTTCSFCDHIYEQNFPSNTWGTEFYIVPYEFASSYTYRVLALQDNTSFLVNGGAPISLNSGEFYEATFVNSATCVQSDSPVSVTQYMQGELCSVTGDPAMLILNDASQKIDNVTFSTVVSPQLDSHGINVIIATEDLGTFSVDGTLVDPSEFSQFPSCPQNSFAQLSISAGSHTLNAPNGFTAYAFGLGEAESYSYSVGSFSANPFGDIEIEDAICSDEEVTLGVSEPGFDLYWYNYDFPNDTLGTDQLLVLETPLVSGIYVGSYSTLISGCDDSEYFSVEVPEPPVLEFLTPDQAICQFENVQLNVIASPVNSFYQYSWSPQLGLDNAFISNPIATPLVSTTYSVTVTSPTGCSQVSSAVTLDVDGGNFSNLSASTSNNEICSGESTQLFAEISEVFFDENFDPGISWGLWSGIINGTESSLCGSIDGNALYFNGAGERSATTIPADVSTGGEVSFALQYGESTFPCDDVDAGEDVVLEYSLDGTNWELIQTFFSFSQTGWEQHSAAIPAAAYSAATQFRWRQLANSGNNEDNWSIDNVSISAITDEGVEFNWFTSDESIANDVSEVTVSPMTDQMYFVEVVDGNSGCSYLDSVFINVGQNFSLELTPDTVLCDIQGIQLEAIPSTEDDFEYTWSPNNGTVSSLFSNSPVVSPAVTTTYSVEVISDQGCVNSGDITVNVNQLLDLTVSASASEICFGESVELEASLAGSPGGINFNWSEGEVLSNENIADPIATPLTNTTFVVTATDSNSGCSLTEDIFIEVEGNFSIDAGEDIETCDAAGLELTAVSSGVGPYIWNWEPSLEVSDAEVSSVNLINNTSNEFIVFASEGECTQTDTVLVNVVFENFDLGPDLSICEGDTIELSTGYIDYAHLWNTNEDTESIQVSSEQLYEITITSDLGCEISDDIYISVLPLPEVDLGSNVELCEGDTYTIDAENVGSVYLWNTYEVSQTIDVITTDTYSVSVTDNNNCHKSDEINVLFHPNPTFELPEDTTICEDQFITFDAGNSGSTYLWNFNSTSSQQITVNLENTYEVEITNVEGCSIIDSVVLSTVNYPNLDLGPDISACENEVVVLNSNADTELNINWNTNESTASILVNTSGIYSAEVDNGYCFTSDEASVFFHPLPLDVLPEELVTCFVTEVGPVILDAGNVGSSFVWSNGSTNSQLEVNEPGLYSVEITTAFNCDTTLTVTVDEFCFGEYLYVPNSFSPNGDGDNDAWKAEGIFIMQFEVLLFNRWGEVVFSSTDVDEYWLGNDQKGNHYVPNGVYSYQIRFKHLVDEFGNVSDWKQRIGTVTVFR